MSLIHLSDNWLRLVDLKNEKTDEYVNNAAVSVVSMTDRNGDTPTGLTLPKTLDYVAASNGVYETLFDRTVITGLQPGISYRVAVDADAGTGLRRRFEAVVKCQSPLQ